MGWSNDIPATFIIPDGATTGARIVLDGVTGIISIYDASSTLVATIDGPGGFKAIGPNGSSVRLVESAGTPQSLYMPPNPNAHVYTEGVVAGFSFGDQPSLQLFSPTVDGLADSKVLVIGRSALGGGSINLQSDQVLILPQAGGADGLLITPADRQIRPYLSGAAAAWTAFPFANAWANAAGVAALQYIRTAFREIRLIGSIVSPTPFAATIGTLPAGFRPTTTQSVWAYAGATPAKLTISPAGVVTAVGPVTTGTTWDINGAFSLDR